MEHITINSDRSVTVPVELRKIGVQYDHNVNTIEFVGPRYSSNVDLSTMTIYINYILSDKTPGKYKAENVIIDDHDDSLIRFNWTITRNVTKVSGILSCLICAKKTDEEGNEINHWNTDIFRLLSVSEGMENDSVIQEQYPDVITSLIQNVEEHNTKLLEFSGLNNRVTDLENNVNEHDAKLLEFSGLDTRVTDIENNVNELKDEKVTMPVDAGGAVQNGISGQILRSNGDGTTQWTSAFPFDVEILDTICENVELTPNNNTYTLPSEITLNLSDLYYIDYKTFSEGVIDDFISGVYFSRVTAVDENYVGWLSDGIILKSTRITDNLMQDSSILSIYKVSLNVSDGVLDVARKLEGERTIASGIYSHAEGSVTMASGDSSHAEGYGTIARGESSHAEGEECKASGPSSHAEGHGTVASGKSSHAEGRYNIEDTEGKYAHIVGNGNAWNNRSNAHTLDWDGNAWFAGDVFVGGSSQDDGIKLLKTGEAIPIPQIASVGQVLVISSVDENGKPTEWKATRFDDVPTDDHINELIRTALNAIGIAEEGAY